MAKCWGANRWLDTVMREDIIHDYWKGCAVWAATNATTSSHIRKGSVYLGECEQSFLLQVKEIIVGGTHFVLQKRTKRQTTPVHGTPRMTTHVILWFLFVKFISTSKSCRPIATKVLFREIHDSFNKRFVGYMMRLTNVAWKTHALMTRKVWSEVVNVTQLRGLAVF